MKPLIYIAGPYTHPDPVENTHRAILAGLRVWESGIAVPLIPHLSLAAHLVQPREADYWYALDLAQLDHCDALVRLPGASTGADREVAHAIEQRIPVFDGEPTDEAATAFVLLGIRNGLVTPRLREGPTER